MIRIDITMAVFLYLAAWIAGFFIVWLFIDREKGRRSYSQDERFIWQCSICTQVYIDSRHDKYSVCPSCGSYNKRETSLASSK